MHRIDQISEHIGKWVSWLSGALVLIISLDTLFRYWFNITSAATIELEWHLFSVLFLLGAAYTLQRDGHVRVDVFYERFSERTKAWVNLLGTVFFLFPFCGVAIYKSLPFVWDALLQGEMSSQPGGLPHRWVIKSSIPLGLSLLALQGVSLALRSLQTLLGK